MIKQPFFYFLILVFLLSGCHKSSPEADLIIAYEGYDKKGGADLIRLANVGKFKRIDSLRILSRQFRALKRDILEQLENDTTERAILLKNAYSGDYKGTELEDEYQLLNSYESDRDQLIGYKYSAEFKLEWLDSLHKNTYLLNASKTEVLGILKPLR